MKTILVQAKHWLKQDFISQTKDITHMKKVQALMGIISTMLLRTTMTNEFMTQKYDFERNRAIRCHSLVRVQDKCRGFTCVRHERGKSY